MSEESVETLVKGFELWNLAIGGDDASWRAALQEMIDHYHPDVELDYRRTLPDFTPTRGTEAIIAWTEGAREAFGSVRIEPKDYIEAGGSIVVPVRLAARGASSGAETAAVATVLPLVFIAIVVDLGLAKRAATPLAAGTLLSMVIVSRLRSRASPRVAIHAEGRTRSA
jgi:hypothetical protein